MRALADGKLCVIDVSQMRGAQPLVLSGLVLRRVFDRNQEEFTSADPRTIPTIAVVEEAQAVLSEGSAGTEPYVSWVKEGRKYDLGAVLVTQQPGSIPTEIPSQGDDWFVFHLLSAADPINLRKANAHFSDDLLSAILNEPIPGHGVFWSSVAGKPYPVPIRVLSFERAYPVLDADYTRGAVDTYARRLHEGFRAALAEAESRQLRLGEDGGMDAPPVPESGGTDALAVYEERAFAALGNDQRLMGKMRGNGASWGEVMYFLRDSLPATMDGREDLAYQLVPRALDALLGGRDQGGWHSFKADGKTKVKAGRPDDT